MSARAKMDFMEMAKNALVTECILSVFCFS